MSNQPPNWTSVVVRFQTAAALPAPYSYFYTLRLTPSNDSLDVALNLKYLDRDELEEEMILEEGFTLDDDYNWEGRLSPVWLAELTQVLALVAARQAENVSESENFIEIEIVKSKAGNSERMIPGDRAVWDYFQQEIMQAIYETSGKERAFEMDYLEIDADNELHLQLGSFFAQRRFSLRVNGSEETVLAWEWTKRVMETVFKADFVTTEALDEKPGFSGKYINPGDGLWYEFNETLVEPGPKSRVLPQIVRLMDQLREEAIR